MARIVIDGRTLRDGSTGRYVERLLIYLQQLDKTNDYVVLLKPEDMDSWQPDNKRFVKAACGVKEYTFAEQLAYPKLLKQHRPDLVHFIMTHQPILYRGRTVTTIHDLTTIRFYNRTTNWLVFKIKQVVYMAVTWIVARKSKQLITPTKFVKDDVAKFTHVKPGKITVTYEAADKLDAKAESVKGLHPGKYIMYVGRPLPHKNLGRLLEAYKQLKQERPDLQLALVGKDHPLYDRFKQQVEAEDIKDVFFTGFASDGQLRWLYENTAAYVFSSLSEGFGLPALEAMLYGAPVISSSATCLPEVYGEAAYYFNPLDIDDMAAKIAEVLDNKKLRQRLTEAGPAQAAKYSWKRMTEQTLEVYNKVLNT